MMEYIDREQVCEKCNNKNYCEKEKCPVYKVSTADVVPKSEVADLQDALKCEKETNKHLRDEYIALMKENEKLTINMNAYGLTAKRLAEEKAEVAREIFEEIELFLNKAIDGWRKERKFCYHNRDIEKIDFRNDAFKYCLHEIANLKKKYTEGET